MSDIISDDLKLEAITKYVQLLPPETAKKELEILAKKGVDYAYKRAKNNIRIVKEVKNRKKRDNRKQNAQKKEAQRKKEEEERVVAKAQEMNVEAQNGYDLYYRIRNSIDFVQNIDDWTVDFDDKKITYANLENYCKEISMNINNFERLNMEIKFRIGKFVATVKSVLDEHNKMFDSNNPYQDDWIKYLRKRGFNKSDDWFFKVRRFYILCKAFPNIRFVRGITYTKIMNALPYIKHLFIQDRDFWCKPKFSSIDIGTGMIVDNKPVYIPVGNPVTITEPTAEDIEEVKGITGSHKRPRVEEGKDEDNMIEGSDSNDDEDEEEDNEEDEKEDENNEKDKQPEKPAETPRYEKEDEQMGEANKSAEKKAEEEALDKAIDEELEKLAELTTESQNSEDDSEASGKKKKRGRKPKKK